MNNRFEIVINKIKWICIPSERAGYKYGIRQLSNDQDKVELLVIGFKVINPKNSSEKERIT